MTAVVDKAHVAIRLVELIVASGFDSENITIARTSINVHLTGQGDEFNLRPTAALVAQRSGLPIKSVDQYDKGDNPFTTVSTEFEGVPVALFGCYDPPADPPSFPPNTIAGFDCQCGFRSWLTDGATDEEHAEFDAETAMHDDCEAVR